MLNVVEAFVYGFCEEAAGKAIESANGCFDQIRARESFENGPNFCRIFCDMPAKGKAVPE